MHSFDDEVIEITDDYNVDNLEVDIEKIKQRNRAKQRNAKPDVQLQNQVEFAKANKEDNEEEKEPIIAISYDVWNIDDRVLQRHIEIIDRLRKEGIDVSRVEIRFVPNVNTAYKKKELQDIVSLCELHQKITGNETEPYFYSEYKNGHEGWGLSRVLKANQRIDQVVEDVKYLSPLEKISYIYSWLTNFPYANGSFEEAKTLVGALTTGKIVCVGYSTIFEVVCKKCGINVFGSGENDNHHMSCVARIDDNKYGVHGVYYFDPTWDSVENSEDPLRIRFFARTYDEFKQLKPECVDNEFYDFCENPFSSDFKHLSQYWLMTQVDILFDSSLMASSVLKQSLDIYKGTGIKHVDKESMSYFMAFVECSRQKYGYDFYTNPEFQKELISVAKEILTNNCINYEDYDLSVFFRPEMVKNAKNLSEWKYFFDWARDVEWFEGALSYIDTSKMLNPQPLAEETLRTVFEIAQKKLTEDTIRLRGENSFRAGREKTKLSKLNRLMDERDI